MSILLRYISVYNNNAGLGLHMKQYKQIGQCISLDRLGHEKIM